MNRWKLTIEYDGTEFCGWQMQLRTLTVQGVIEEAIARFSGEDVRLHVAGRTDTGVHAHAQVAHFDLHKDVDAGTAQSAINFFLRPRRVVILQAEKVAPSFHARFDAVGRSYRYRIINRRPPLALDAHKAWHVVRPLDCAAMHRGAQSLLGTHDFSTFRAQDCQAKSPIRTLDRLEVTQDGEEIVIFAAARSFLYHQVRNMVGTLVLVGSGQWTQADLDNAFAACDRSRGGPTAPAHGLCFWETTYR